MVTKKKDRKGLWLTDLVFGVGEGEQEMKAKGRGRKRKKEGGVKKRNPSLGTHTHTQALFAAWSTKETCNASRFLLVEYQRHALL